MNNQEKVIYHTESVCPVCLERIDAWYVEENRDIYLKKRCLEHGDFSTIVWRGHEASSFFSWKKEKLIPYQQNAMAAVDRGCPYDCGLCPEHRQRTCCVLLEVTDRCNQNCSFCYADSGGITEDPSFETIKGWLEMLAERGKPFLHISGGEPTVREDLPQIVSLARDMGFEFIQLNTNGLRLGQEPGYARKLKDAGVSVVFMQFDGTNDQIFEKLRGRPLLKDKEAAIKNCSECYLGVVLVPTIIPGINSENIGEILRYSLHRIPDVRGVHFQPVSYFGRYPKQPVDSRRMTLPELLGEIERQTQGVFKASNFAPSRCDHPHCGFHGDFVLMPDGNVRSLTQQSKQKCCCEQETMGSAVEKSRSFVSRRWVRETQVPGTDERCCNSGFGEWEDFIARVKSHGFSITGMLFQDCWNLDLERLKACSLHVLDKDGRIIPFCAYNLSNIEGKRLYRSSGDWRTWR
ncbi:radical SAM (seleno)protein TrsS [Petroclostridium sp. X23]|uniref:radical SAM (seleno)protein TrsS n=1 Tax=Petroclostridium sp. X23 TaxID=3045146 RepID=UPI0024AE6905|nr:radical SAM (seleno)protein TrsS [Petroclostridium sp. X23]WHH60490.1 radical SAM protein [Petroclostridium sp. X23]